MFEYKKIVDEMLKQNGFEHQSLSYLEKRYKDTEYFGDEYNESLRLFKFLFAAHTKVHKRRVGVFQESFGKEQARQKVRHGKLQCADANEKIVYRRVSAASSGICERVCENAFRRRVRILSAQNAKTRNCKFIVTKRRFKVCNIARNVGIASWRNNAFV